MIIHEWERIPFLYGYVAYDFSSHGKEYLPMPFHLVKRWWIHSLAKIRPSWYDKGIIEARIEANQEGYRLGYDVGFRAGERKGMDDAMTRFRKMITP